MEGSIHTLWLTQWWERGRNYVFCGEHGRRLDWEYSSVVECLPSQHALALSKEKRKNIKSRANVGSGGEGIYSFLIDKNK